MPRPCPGPHDFCSEHFHSTPHIHTQTYFPGSPAEMKFTRRHFLSLAAAAIVAGGAHAQTWPAKPITMVVSYPAGGDTDAVARLLGDKLSAKLGQQVIIDNRPGASGAVGNAFVAHAPADGYTMLFTPSTFPIAPLVLKLGQGV